LPPESIKELIKDTLENNSVQENDRKAAEIVSLMFGRHDSRVTEVRRLLDSKNILTYSIGAYISSYYNFLVNLMQSVSKPAWKMWPTASLLCVMEAES
jgi:hypothetical protein